MLLLGKHGDYDIALGEAPLAAPQIEALARLLGHKGEPWLEDIRRRYAGNGPDFCVVARHGEEAVSHIWVGPDAAYRRFAVLGHVFTVPEHRRKGLARFLLRTALARWDAGAGGVLVLGVDNPAAAPLYLEAGFLRLCGPDAHGHELMIRGDAADELLAGRWPAANGPIRRAPLGPAWYASGILLLNVFPGDAKLPSLQVTDGHDAELRLLEGIQRAGAGDEVLDALIDEATGCLVGIEHVTRNGRCCYTPPCTARP